MSVGPLGATGGHESLMSTAQLWLHCAVEVFLLEDDLRQHGWGDVGAGRCVVDKKISSVTKA